MRERPKENQSKGSKLTSPAPRYNALVKTDKENYPMRPIVPIIGSPTYQISKYLSKISTPLTNLANQKLKNSYQVLEILSEMSIFSDDVIHHIFIIYLMFSLYY